MMISIKKHIGWAIRHDIRTNEHIMASDKIGVSMQKWGEFVRYFQRVVIDEILRRETNKI